MTTSSLTPAALDGLKVVEMGQLTPPTAAGFAGPPACGLRFRPCASVLPPACSKRLCAARLASPVGISGGGGTDGAVARAASATTSATAPPLVRMKAKSGARPLT